MAGLVNLTPIEAMRQIMAKLETLSAENARLSGLAANEVLRTARLSAENAILREAITECIGILALQHYDKYIAEARILHATNDCKCKIAATLRIARSALAKAGA